MALSSLSQSCPSFSQMGHISWATRFCVEVILMVLIFLPSVHFSNRIQALDIITAHDALGWFSHCGYFPLNGRSHESSIFLPPALVRAAWAAARRAIGTPKGGQLT